MLRRSVLALLIAACAAFPALSRASENRWEVIHVYSLAEGRSVAIGVPAEWERVGDGRGLGMNSTLRFLDETGNRIEIPVAALLRAAAEKRVIRAEDARKLGQKVRNWS
jgi:hypothetical protein